MPLTLYLKARYNIFMKDIGNKKNPWLKPKRRPLDLVDPGEKCFCQYYGDPSTEDGCCYWCFHNINVLAEIKYDYRTGKLL